MTRSPLALFLFKGLATKHTTVKWTIKNDLKARIMKIAWFSKSPIDSYSEKSSHHHFPKVGRWTLLPCGDFARLFLNMDFTTIKRGLDCCLKIKWHCRILKNRKKNVNFCFKTSVPARKQEISIKTVLHTHCMILQILRYNILNHTTGYFREMISCAYFHYNTDGCYQRSLSSKT